jgi:protein-disulfide isomerase
VTIKLRPLVEWTFIGLCGAILISAVRTVVVDRLEARTPVNAAVEPRVVVGASGYASRGHVSGSDNAEHTLVVFSDFECPFCRAYSISIDSLKEMHPRLRIVERHYPIEQLHAFAVKAANAAECAGELKLYEPVRNALYTRQAIVQAEEWGLLGRVAGVGDTASFAECVRLEKHREAVNADIEAARSLGARGTPAVLLDSLFFDQPPSREQLSAILDSAGGRRTKGP